MYDFTKLRSIREDYFTDTDIIIVNKNYIPFSSLFNISTNYRASEVHSLLNIKEYFKEFVFDRNMGNVKPLVKNVNSVIDNLKIWMNSIPSTLEYIDNNHYVTL